MLNAFERDSLARIAKCVAAQFGSNCEVVVHEIDKQDAEHTIVAIENGHVTGRKVGDGPSQVALEQMGKSIDAKAAEDHLCYLARTPDGKLIKSSTVYIRDSQGAVSALFCINMDISALAMAGSVLNEFTTTKDPAAQEPEPICTNVNDLLDDLIRRSVALVGKPVEFMTKEDKVRAIQFLSRSGALLITRSGDKIAKHFGISKYTLYSYLDAKQEEKNQ